jgi:hypothetical protein
VKIILRSLALAATAFVSLCGDAHAWSDPGHKIICEIAFRLAQPGTQAAIRKLMEIDTEFRTFADSCVYPDHPIRGLPRIRSTEHYVNLPRDSKGLTSDQCPKALNCVLSAIRDDSKSLSSKTIADADRLIALKSLGHWVGDIHQPLHVSFEDDRGGNNIRVNGQCAGNLHAAWDNCLVLFAVGPDISEAVTELIGGITSEMRERWASSEPRDWANESFAISKAVTTGYCEMRGDSCDVPRNSVTIGAEYLVANEPIVKEQLQKAAVRLARVLNSAFGSGN